ncbi:MAG: hypothetical protein SwBeaBPW_26710 [Shewanella algae]
MSQEQASQIDKRLNKRLKDTPIAIVGMASLFAGSRYLNQFWDLICDKIDAITQVPADRWQVADYFDPDKKAADKSYCKRGGFIPEVDFNPMEFGLPPNILELTDTSQLLSLVVAKEVLEDAGIHEGSDYDRDRIGITLGIGGGQKISQSLNARLQYPVLKKVFRESGVSEQDSEMLIRKFQDQYIHWEENSFPGSLGNVIAGRIANRFDLGGMNCVVDAACAGSLAAMRMALTELTEGRSDMMLTGGVCTDNSAYMYMSFSKTPAFTSDEQIKPFDADSRGMMIGEGIGMVALKRLDDAERDGDRIYAVIKGVGASSDGKFKSIYAPRPEGQAKALRRAYDDAGFPPHTLGLMEAHGTGTAAGDVAEFNGLNAVMSQDNPELQHIALGSIKSQVGHTKSTAGTAGVIKAALALHHKVLPPTINVKQPNPKMAVEQSPFYLNTQTRPWMPRTDGTPRRAAVSSFGFGGTNFHLVLEEHSPELPKQPARLRRTPLPLLFCAPDKPALEQEISALLKTLNSDAHGDLETLCAPYRLGSQTQVQGPRLGLLACDTIELQQKLQQALNKLQSTAEEQPQTRWQHQGVEYRSAPLTEAKTAALFAGQGSQYLQMGSGLTQLYPELRAEFAAADREFSRQGIADKYGMGPLSARVFPIAKFTPQASKEDELVLANTRFAQSAIGALGMGQFTLLCQAGFQADMLAGHSFGELSALRAAGALSRESYYALAFARGDAMASVPEDKDPGAMSAVILPSAAERNTLEQLLQTEPEVQIANINSPVQLVIAGASEAVARLNLKLNEAGLRAIALPVSGAFHTPLVAHAQQPFAEAIARQGLSDAKTPLYVNATGDKLAQDAESLRANLEQHMLKQVRFSEQIESMYRDGARIFVEFGPKNTLARLAQTTLGDRAAECLFLSLDSPSCIDSLAADTELKQALISLALAGLPLTDPDAYRAVQTQAKHKASPMTIKLGASNYISPATAQKMAASLKEGRVSQQTKIVEKVVEKIVEIPVAAASQNPSQPSQATAPQAANGLSANSGSGLQQFFSAQQQLAELHQQFLNIPLQYGNSVQQLLAEQVKLATAGKAIPDSLNQTLAMFHQHQAETLKIHNDFIQSQNLGAQQLLQQLQDGAVLPNIEQTQAVAVSVPVPVQAAAPLTHAAAPVKAASTPQQPSQVLQSRPQAPAPVPAVAVTTAKPSTGVEELMLQVVAEKTGYPTEMLELGMDMEADLGIDSIKRVEILGTVQDQLPNLPQLDAATLSECRTLGQIVDYLQQSTGVDSSVQPEPIQPSPALSSTAHADQNDVTALMLQVVADKTGYPAEMLELGMDMEADLGIDSIKRVEILGTVQDQLPELPQLDAASLSECRTLGQIIDCFAGSNAEHAAEPLTQTDETPNTQPSVALPPHSGVSLKKLPAADRFSGASAEALFAANSCALLLDDGHNAGVLAKKLTDSGISVTLVRPAATDSQSALDSKLPILTLASNDDAGVEALIAGLKQQVAIYIHLQPQLPREQLGELMPLNITAKTQVQLSFLFAKHLSPAWQTPTKGRRAFITVARMDGQLGFSGQPCELNQSALFGLTKTLAQEWPQVHCRALDLAPELDASALASQVMDALYSPSQDPLEWGKSAAGRVTLVATSADDLNAADTSLAPCRLDSSDKILVTGGAKGVTLDCALALARQSGSHFILAGRSKALALEAFPDWAQGLESGQLKAAAITALLAKGQKPSPKEVEALIKPLVNALEIHAALKRFEAIGASAEYLSLDVSNPDAVASTLAPIQALAPISGLIHGAGVLADKHIADKTLAELELVTGTKVGGLSALLRALAPNKKAAEHLKLLALFSSAAGFYGNTGQSDYAMANEILNKTAHRLHHELPTTRVISFNWGPWDGGMVNAALKQMFESRGVYVIPREAGAKLFAEAILARSEPQLLIGSSMQGPGGKQGLNHTDTLEAQASPQTLSRAIKRQELALLEDHCIGGNPVWPTVCALQWMLQSAQSLFGGDWRAVDYKLLKGVVFDSDEKRLQLSLTLGTDGELQASISCDERPQYQATLLPLIQQPLMPQQASQPLAHVSMTEIGEGELQVRQGSEFYHSGALFHGPQLQAITEVLQFDDQGLSCRYRLPDAASSEDRALIQQDALLQAMLIWARLKYDAASLPSSLAALWQNALLPENDTGLIRLQVTKHSSRQLSADLALFNAEGQLQTGLENAKVTISKGLNAAFEPAKAATGNRERP